MTETLLEGLGLLGQGLSYPGDMVRGLLAGKAGERVTGHQLLQHLGMDPGDDWMGTGAGIGVDIATDPLTYAGGALVKGLGGVLNRGRKARNTVGTPEWDRANVFDLPGDTAVADNLDLIDNAFPVPTAPATSPLAAAVAPKDVPLPMLGKTPEYKDYSNSLLYRADPFDLSGQTPTSVPLDLVGEGRNADALRASIGGWDAALDDLARGPGAGEWEGPIRGHLNTLEAVRQMGPAVSDPSLLPLVAGQRDRIRNMYPHIGAGYGAYPLEAVETIHAGKIMPSDVWDVTRNTMGHLPLDEAATRRLAAQSQMGHGAEHIARELRSAEVALPLPGTSMSDEAMEHLLNQYGDHFGDSGALSQILRQTVDPDYYARANNIEPNIARSLLADANVVTPEGHTVADIRRWISQLDEAERMRIFPADDGFLWDGNNFVVPEF